MGREEEKHSIALKMIKEGIEISIIAKCTSLSEEDIQKLRKENKLN